MRFSVRALDARNAVTVLEIDADGEAHLQRQLSDRALVPIRVRRVLLSGPWRVAPAPGRRFELVLFLQELIALLNAGLGLVESLEALSEAAHGGTQRVVGDVLGHVRAGHAFAKALAAQAGVFPPLLIGLVQAGEGSGGVPHALSRYVEYRQRLDSVRSTVVGALVYPVILALVGMAVTTFLLLYVVPRFAAVYQGTGRALPWLTQQMLAWGRVASEHSAAVAAVAVLGVAAVVFATWRGVRSGRLMQALLHLPVLGQHIKLYGLSRLYLTLSMLLANGLPIRAAIDAAVTVVPHKLRRDLLAARDDIVSGQAISTAFHRHGLTTVISTRLLQAGEHAGDLARMFEQAAAFYEGSNARFLQRFTRAFEPLLMVAIGLVVGVIVLLLYMPIFDLAASVQ